MADPAGGELCLVLVETGAKQAYIFDTAKRREAVGASQLVSEVAEVWSREALRRLPGVPVTDPSTWRVDAGDPAEILLASAGTFLTLVRGAGPARAVLRTLTGRAFRDAPGLDVHGTVVPGLDWHATGPDGPPAAKVVGEAFRTAIGRARVARPHPAMTHPVDPFARLCRTSGLPAEHLVPESPASPPQERSREAWSKLQAADRVVDRLAERFATVDVSPRWPKQTWVRELRRADRYLADTGGAGPARVAIIHADGNGLGQVFGRLADHLAEGGRDGLSAREYADGYRRFSQGLDAAATAAFVSAYHHVLGRASDRSADARAVRDACQAAAGGDDQPPVVPVLPLVLGGDDLTVVADARVAPALLRAYLREFVARVAATPALSGPLRRATGHPGAGVAAGIADVGAHFPFLSAYELAEELCREAKVVKTVLADTHQRTVPATAWSYHAVLDGTSSTLDAIRDRQLTSDGALLTGAPYLEAPPEGLPGAAAEWARGHDVSHLHDCVDALITRDEDGRRVLPASPVHRLRETLTVAGLAAANHELETLIRIDEAGSRVPSPWLRLAAADEAPTLGVGDGTQTLVPLIDAMTLADGRAL